MMARASVSRADYSRPLHSAVVEEGACSLLPAPPRRGISSGTFTDVWRTERVQRPVIRLAPALCSGANGPPDTTGHDRCQFGDALGNPRSIADGLQHHLPIEGSTQLENPNT